jgi:hypothetical protein
MAKFGFFDRLRKTIVRDTIAADHAIREGRFQKILALIAGCSSLLSGLEVTYEHYRGSYGQRIMWSPVILSPLLFIAGVWTFFDKRATRRVLPSISAITLIDCLIGFGFHVRGIHRKPGGWRLPVANLIMGPPIFAPLLFGLSAYLGLIAAFLRREDAPTDPAVHPVVRPFRTLMELQSLDAPIEPDNPAHDGSRRIEASEADQPYLSWEQDIREGRFQKHLAAAAAAASLFSGIEALYSHYKNNFRYKAQWTPVVSSALLTGAGIAAVVSRRAARTALPLASLIAVANGTAGFYYHVRGVLRRPGGPKLKLYNLVYGPPVLAPLLFAACGALGVLASLMRREK